MKYAADLNVNYVLMAGEEERHQGVWTVRHMESGDQQKVSEQAVSYTHLTLPTKA